MLKFTLNSILSLIAFKPDKVNIKIWMVKSPCFLGLTLVPIHHHLLTLRLINIISLGQTFKNIIPNLFVEWVCLWDLYPQIFLRPIMDSVKTFDSIPNDLSFARYYRDCLQSQSRGVVACRSYGHPYFAIKISPSCSWLSPPLVHVSYLWSKQQVSCSSTRRLSLRIRPL